MSRPLFNKHLRDLIESGRLSQTAFAAKLGVTPATLRTWLKRNCFPELAIKRIFRELGQDYDRDAVEQAFEIKFARLASSGKLYEQSPLRSAFIVADRERSKIAVAMSPMGKSIETFCAAMGKDDLMITLAATVTPWEMEQTIGQPMRDAILHGVRAGGTFLYLRANQEQVERYRSDWNFDRLRDREDCDREITTFRGYLSGQFQSEGMIRTDADERAYRATPQYLVRGDTPFFAPGFHMIMFRSSGYPGGEDDRMMVRLPDNSWAAVYLTRADYFRDRFRRSVCIALDEEQTRLSTRQAELAGERKKRNGRPSNLEELEARLKWDTEILERLKGMLAS